MGKREQAHADLRHALDALGELKPGATWGEAERQRWSGVDEALGRVVRKRDPLGSIVGGRAPLAAFRMAWNEVIGVATLRPKMSMSGRIAAMRKLAPVMLDILLGEEE